MGCKIRSCVIIPARFASARFPGKPLVFIQGKPMILWVTELSAQAVGKEHIYVATEDARIATIVEAAGFTALMTSKDALTGTDRLAEAAELVDYDIYVNVQGDEPMVDYKDIVRCIQEKQAHMDKVINGFCWISETEDPKSVHIPKVVATEDGIMLYMSRSLIPGFKEMENAPNQYMKQVCIYGFTKEELVAYRGFGRKSQIEQSEDIEILRFLEQGKQVRMFETQPGSIAVDVPEDVARVEEALRAKGKI